MDPQFRYNTNAVYRVNQLERIFVKIGHPEQCQFVALCNALETQAELGTPHLPTVGLLAQAVVVYAMSRGVDVDRSGVARALRRLTD